MTQEALAETAGLSLKAVSALERGQRRYPYPNTVRVLADALGLEPGDRIALTAVATRRGALEHPDEITRPNLPVPVTPMFGREAEAAKAVDLLRLPELRMLTMTGPGGVGKTRLSLRVAELANGSFADGSRFVALASVADVDQVIAGIVQALNLRGAANDLPRNILVRYLANREMLLVLDNFEQVVEAAAGVVDLLGSCPRLTLIVTSRIPLHVDGEQEFPVRPLPVPRSNGHIDLSELERAPAVALFVQRSRAVRPDFALTGTNAAAVTELCARLDGLPLAIELAAAWSRLLSPQAMLEHRDHRLSLLTGGGPDRPERLQTMRGAIDWSFDHLQTPQQALFRRLSVCMDGCSLEAAAAVAALASPADAEANDFLADVVALVDHSLVQRNEWPDGEIHLRMLETIREYGLERLVEAGEADAARQSHAVWFLGFATGAATQLDGAQRGSAMVRVQREQDNLHAALSWFHEHDRVDEAHRLACALAKFWIGSGNVSEGRAWLDRVLAMTGALAPEIRFETLYWASILASLQEALSRALELGEEALALARETGNKLASSMILAHLGDLVGYTDLDKAHGLIEQSLAIARELKDPFREATALRQLGLNAYYKAHYEIAASNHGDALAIWRRLDHQWGVPISLRSLAETVLAQGDLRQAGERYRESLMRWRELGERINISDCLTGLARVSLMSGDGEHAGLLLGAQNTLDVSMGYVHTRSVHSALNDDARAAVGEAVFDEAWEYGQTLPLDAVLDMVMTEPALSG